MSADEVIHESATGGKKAGNLDQYDLIPPRELRQIAAFYATPYADAWAGGSFNELSNQLWWFWEGSDVDPETGYNRLVHVAFHGLELLTTYLPAGTVGGQEDGIADSPTRYDHIPAEPLRLLAHHYGRGAQKYDPDNWQKGYDWRLSFAALNRHLWQHQSGQFLDEETGSPHLVAVVWHAITLMWFYANRPEFDTRTSTKAKQAEVPNLLSEIGSLAPEFEEAADAILAGWLLPEAAAPKATAKFGGIRHITDEEKERQDPKRPVVYISGPMTGMPDHNFPAFHEAAAHYRGLGYTVINPAELPGEGDDHPWEWYLRRDLIAMLEGGADTIVLLPNWSQSKGARLEQHVAMRLGFKTIYHRPELDTEQEVA